eukprot:3725056-Amphidinium_carterae.1
MNSHSTLRRSGWGYLLTDVLAVLKGRSELADVMVQAASDAIRSDLGEMPLRTRSPRIRSRVHRRLSAHVLHAMCSIGLRWLGSGGLSAVGSEAAHQLPHAPFQVVSRSSPLAFAGDTRGRMQALCNAILSGRRVENERVKVERHPLYLGYESDGGNRSATVYFVAERLAIPEKSANVPLDPWLSRATRVAWNNPVMSEPEVVESGSDTHLSGRSYFAASQLEWRAALRRMHRSGLLRLLPPHSCPAGSAAGAFAVTKDESKDRLIGDRRPANSQERMPGPVRLPYAPRLRRIVLKRGQGLWVGKRDLSNCFYLFRVDEARLGRQVIGPRVPRSWFDNVSDVELDFAPDFECWCSSDLGLSAGEEGAQLDPASYCQIAMAAVMMGDLGAVTVVQEAHSRMMVANRVLHPGELIGGSPEFAWHKTMGDVYIDDLVLLVLGSLAYPPDELRLRLAAADKAYADAELVVKKEKGQDAQLNATFWGASLRGEQGLLGYSVDRRSSLSAVTLFALAFGASGNQLRQLLGTWGFCLGFRREAMSILGSSFSVVSMMKPRVRVLVSGSLLDELLVLIAIAPIMEADLRTPPLKRAGELVVFATDAEGSGGIGGCVAPIDVHRWKLLYALAEERGAYVYGGVQEQRASWVTDHRETAAQLTCDLEWRVTYSLGGPKIPASVRGTSLHINILELRAVFILLQRLIKQGVQYCRIILLCDSLVAVSVLGKGRSSSGRINFMLRRISAMLLRYRIMLDVVWVPTWANPSDAPSRGIPLGNWKESVQTTTRSSRPSLRVPPQDAEAWRRLLEGSVVFGDDHSDLQKWHIQGTSSTLPVASEDAKRPDKDEAWRKWKFDWLMTCGDIESQPGPRSRIDLLTNDVTQRTADRYHQSLAAFESWLGSQGLQLTGVLHKDGLAEAVRHAIRYLRCTFISEELTPSAANYLGAALRRFALLTSSLGFSLGDVRAQMQPYWRVVRSLHLALPPEFRAPVPATLALSLALWGFLR